MSPNDQLRAHWDAFAEHFERAMEPTTVLLAQTLLAQLALGSARALLEVGCGAGGGALAALGALAPGARFVAVDLAERMVARARARLPQRVEVREADAEALPFAAGSFDRALSNLTIQLVPDPDRALGELARVLAPGGLLAFSVWGRPEGSPMFTLPVQAAQRVGIVLPQEARTNFHLGEREALRRRVAAAGFERVAAWYHPMARADGDGASYAAAMLGSPRWRDLLRGEPPERAAALERELAALGEAHLARGEPLALEALLVVARRAAG